MKRLYPLIALLTLSSLSTLAIAQVEYIFSTIDKSISQPDFTQTTEARTFWGLSEEEWTRYEQIIKDSPWAIWKHEATPLALLAHYSKSESDKRRYARRQAELDQWREGVTFAWQQLYNQEREQVNDAYVKSIQHHIAHKALTNLNEKDQVIVFIHLEQCEESCLAESRKVLDSGATAHLYFFGDANRETITHWAKKMEIPVQRVQERKVTLNTHKGEGHRYGVNSATLKESNGSQTFFRHISGVKEIR